MDSDLWYQYLVLFSKHGDSSDLTDFCQMAVECATSFQIWWLVPVHILNCCLVGEGVGSDFWFQYLVLFSKHGDSSDLTDFCQMAVECATSFQIWWLVSTYT